eukprot:5430672-Amphidinium_carterae.1
MCACFAYILILVTPLQVSSNRKSCSKERTTAVETYLTRVSPKPGNAKGVIQIVTQQLPCRENDCTSNSFTLCWQRSQKGLGLSAGTSSAPSAQKLENSVDVLARRC